MKKETPTQCFPVNLVKLLKNLIEHLLRTASVFTREYTTS